MTERIALITGASSGIGESLSRELLAKGWTVVGVARSNERLEALKENHKNFHAFPCDVTDPQAIKQVSSQLVQSGLIPQLFFLNAGVAGESAMEPNDCLDTKTHEDIFQVNYFGVIEWISQWLDICQTQGGATFMVTSSVNAIFAPPCGSAYAASKAAISKAFEGFQLQYSHTNLNFLVLYAGPVKTPGLAGELPFTWPPQKMATYMIKKALNTKKHSEPSWYYSTVCRLLRALPASATLRILGVKNSSKKTS